MSSCFLTLRRLSEDDVSIGVLEHHTTIWQIFDIELGLRILLGRVSRDSARWSVGLCEECSPAIVSTHWTHRHWEVVRVPGWSAVEVCVEEVFDAPAVTEALYVDGYFGEELHHTVDDDPATETTIVGIHLFVLA